MAKGPTAPDEIRRKIASATRSAEFETIAREIENIEDREDLIAFFKDRTNDLELDVPAELRAYAERIAEHTPQFEDAVKVFSLADSLVRLDRLRFVGASAQLELLAHNLKRRSLEEPLWNAFRGQIYSDTPAWWKAVKD